MPGTQWALGDCAVATAWCGKPALAGRKPTSLNEMLPTHCGPGIYSVGRTQQ